MRSIHFLKHCMYVIHHIVTGDTNYYSFIIINQHTDDKDI